jgi:hypothetical protein
MKSINQTKSYPSGISLIADDIIEFHATRLLLLIQICGKKDRAKKLYRIEGLTKLAKLDFFIRYPEFFRRVVAHLNKQADIFQHTGGVESRMIRYHYGPWDERYYQVLPYLESRSLIKIEKEGNSYSFYLTDTGDTIAAQLKTDPDFEDLVNNIKDVDKLLSTFSGSALKSLVYKLFETEVADKKMGELI